MALPAPQRLSATLDVYNILRKFQRNGVWEAIWAELHMALRERGWAGGQPLSRGSRQPILDSQSVKSTEKVLYDGGLQADGEETLAGTRGNDEDAPKADSWCRLP